MSTPTTAPPAPTLEAGPAARALWDAAAPTYAHVLEHPFLAGLVDGTLGEDAFRQYVVQDALYLRSYARALAVCAARAPEDAGVEMFADHAKGALVVERALHDEFLAELGVTPEQLDATAPSPACAAYTSYLLATAYGGSFAEALAAVLPCYWVYAEVGAALTARVADGGTPGPMHRRWVETYGGEEFTDLVRAVLALTERVVGGAGERERELCTRHVVATTRYEWMFWDSAWRQEAWPV